ncbi:hypothetical protein ACB098_10G013500 [Castanea mollissima]
MQENSTTSPSPVFWNKRVCIDLSCWMVQLQNVSKSHSCMKEKVYLRGLFHRLRAFIAVNCTIVFVTDGSIPAIKLSTYRRRLKSGSDVKFLACKCNHCRLLKMIET